MEKGVLETTVSYCIISDMSKTNHVITVLVTRNYIENPQDFYKIISNLMMNDFKALQKDLDIVQLHKEKFHIQELLNDLSFLLGYELIDHRQAKTILNDAWDIDPYAWDIGWYLTGFYNETKLLDGMDENSFDKIVQDVITENSKAVEQYKNGKENALNSLIGQVMKKTKGKADPKETKIKLMEMANG